MSSLQNFCNGGLYIQHMLVSSSWQIFGNYSGDFGIHSYSRSEWPPRGSQAQESCRSCMESTCHHYTSIPTQQGLGYFLTMFVPGGIRAEHGSLQKHMLGAMIGGE